ncbi:MAG: aldehyde dehydrogenase family protein [Saprospiraceae bacterium]
MKVIKTISPVDGSIYAERPLATKKDVEQTLKAAQQAQRLWRDTKLEERAALCSKALDYFAAHQVEIGQDITWQMGRPIRYSAGEVKGVLERGRHMISIAESTLADLLPKPQTGFHRFIRREPVGIVFTIAPWNYPLLTTVNSVIPALMAGNVVILKPSAQTPLCGEHFKRAFEFAGLPKGVFQLLFLDHHATTAITASGQVDLVCFTGSVEAGRVIEKSLAGTFAHSALELGGKDPAYVRPDVDLSYSVEQLVDGAFFNSGQSCCGIERIYVHQDLYKSFVEQYVELVKKYELNNPTLATTTLGPMVKTSAANWVQQQIDAAINDGATACISSDHYPTHRANSPYFAPQVMIDVNHSMSIMREESFGPVVGIMPVKNDAEAVTLMNDSDLGLTASLWTNDAVIAEQLGNQIETGTVFMNRCDYLDPALAWTGVKNTGRGVSLSELGYGQLTQPKSFHFKIRE